MSTRDILFDHDTLLFDIETDGLLDELTKLHCLVLKDADTGETWSCTPHWDIDGGLPRARAEASGVVPLTVSEGLAKLARARLIVGHNVLGFDIPALRKLFPWWAPGGQVQDTMIMARVVWPKDVLTDRDHLLRSRQQERRVPVLPGNLIGSYSLEAFGWRLGDYKGDYKGGWEHWSDEMQAYCEQDVEVTAKLLERIRRENWSETCFTLEHEVAEITLRQERYGFFFDSAKAADLLVALVQDKEELEKQLFDAFPPIVVRTPFLPKVNNKSRGYVKGVWTEKVRIEDFNPASRDHIAKRLMGMGWVPDELTETGKPKVDETVLSQLPFPEAKLLSRYLLIEKRIGQLSNGAEAWLKKVKADGRIHGRVNSNGALTGRMTHSSPNMAQVPAGGSPYGHECRALFTVPRGKKLVGCDADALELRCLAHFMAAFDNGDYIRVVLEGRKEEGTDIHSVNCRALGMDPKESYAVDGIPRKGRDIAKVWFYAFIYGAGDEKLGAILGKSGPKTTGRRGQLEDKTAIKAGKSSRAQFLQNLPALGNLVEAIKNAVAARGFLSGLDGRRLYVRSDRAAPNTLLQSAGALLMKKALVLLDCSLQGEHGLVPGKHYEFVANVHDEWQIEADEEHAELVGRTAAEAIRRAGDAFKFRCPLAGQYQIGANWADTH